MCVCVCYLGGAHYLFTNLKKVVTLSVANRLRTVTMAMAVCVRECVYFRTLKWSSTIISSFLVFVFLLYCLLLHNWPTAVAKASVTATVTATVAFHPQYKCMHSHSHKRPWAQRHVHVNKENVKQSGACLPCDADNDVANVICNNISNRNSNSNGSSSSSTS